MIKKILHTTIAKIILGFILILAVYVIPMFGLHEIARAIHLNPIVRYTSIPIIITTLILLSYKKLFRYYEKREITEISTFRIGRYLLIGSIIGVSLFSLSILVNYLRTEFTVISVNEFTDTFIRDFIISIFSGMLTAIFEEVLFRGILFRLIEEKWGSYSGLIVSSLFFGFLHLLNGSDSIIPAFSIMVASIALGAAYMYSRSLWFPIAIHFSWNFVGNNILGSTVSGVKDPSSILVTKLEGSKWFTGGAWGIEASIQIIVLCLITAIELLVLCKRKGLINPTRAKLHATTIV